MVSTAQSLPALRADAQEIFLASLETCRIEGAFQDRIAPAPSAEATAVPAFRFRLRGAEEIDLTPLRRVLIVAVGKGATPMLTSLLQSLPLPPSCEVRGVLIAPSPPAEPPLGVEYFAGGHPLPNQASLAGAQAALRLVAENAMAPDAAQTTFCFFLVSGGASAMMELPLDPRISLSDVLALHQTLIHSGATIAEINCVRKHFSAVKGGRLRQAAGQVRSLTIAISDVPGGYLDALGSGPTLPDSSSVTQCREILSRYALAPQLPLSIQEFFAGELAETPKPGELDSPVVRLLSSEDLAEVARVQAEALGFHTVCDDCTDDWDYRDAAEYLVTRLRALRREHSRVCLIAPGEVTVKVSADATRRSARIGRGGRNQHFALYCATLLSAADSHVVVLSAGSDGIDGNSPAAGAIVDSALLEGHGAAGRGNLRQVASEALRDFDSFTFLNELGASLTTGPTGNNLRDLRILLAVPSPDSEC